MTLDMTSGQLSILHSLSVGDDPLLRAPDTELIFYERDLALLSSLGFLERHGKRLMLTPSGLSRLEEQADGPDFFKSPPF